MRKAPGARVAPEKARVCVLSTAFPRVPGDVFGTFVAELCAALVRRGWPLTVVAPHEGGLPARETREAVEIRRFRYLPGRCQRVAYGDGIPTNLRRSWVARLQVPFFLLGYWLRAALEMRRARLVHCHWTVSGLVAWLARPGRRPVVLSVRGSDVHLARSAFGRAVNRFICQRMDAVLAVSEEIAAVLGDIGVDRERIHVVPNGVDGRFRPGDRGALRRELGLAPEAVTILFVGLLVPVKGLDTLLEALARMREADWQCILVGDGSLRQELEAAARAAGLAERVRFVGRQPSSEVPRWMGAADLLVLPSRSEGRPNVVLEAQACGLPVVATRVGGTPELVRHDETGFLVAPDAPDELAASLGRLVGDAAARRAMGSAARRHVESGDFTWEAAATKVEELYTALLEGKGRRPALPAA